MTITAKYAGTCKSCGDAFSAGARIDWTKATGPRHESCRYVTPRYRASSTYPRVRSSNYARFSSGAETFSNARGRCEDAPCCGCCS